MTNFDYLILKYDDQNVDELISENAKVLHRSGEICVLAHSEVASNTAWRDLSSGWTRMFERMYLAPVLDVERSQLVASFFGWLGSNYCQEIDLPRNLQCYEFLFDRLRLLRQTDECSPLLDVGCGPGTILQTSLTTRVAVIRGYDLSMEVMRSALKSGLAVITLDEFLNGKQEYALALSAFTMHYACNVGETSRAVARQLAAGGMWAMNFHKGINYSLFIAGIQDAGLGLVEQPLDSPFGPVVTVVALKDD